MPCIFCKMPYVSQAPVQALSATPCIFEINECIMRFFNIVFPLISHKAVGPTDMFSNQTYLEIFFLSP